MSSVVEVRDLLSGHSEAVGVSLSHFSADGCVILFGSCKTPVLAVFFSSLVNGPPQGLCFLSWTSSVLKCELVWVIECDYSQNFSGHFFFFSPNF